MNLANAPATVAVTHLEVRDLRNLGVVDLEPSVASNIFCGDNGQGKTSLLEAIYLVATTRSFRTHRLRDLIRHGAGACSVRARIAGPFGVCEQQVGLSATKRIVRIDGQKAGNVAQYALRTPVIVFHPGELGLTMGPASGRRTLMDRIALFCDPGSHLAHQAYGRAMKARQTLLQAEGPDAAGLDAYEWLMVKHGVELTGHRKNAVESLISAMRQTFEQLAPSGLQLDARYAPGGSLEEQEVQRRLFDQRRQDGRRSSAGFGPHRDDLVFALNGRSARTDASQGQHRILTLSVKLAELACIGEASGIKPILLLDDVSSELDADRTEAFFKLLGLRKDQVFLTTTRPEMLPVYEQRMGEVRVFEVVSGCIIGKGS